MSILVFILICLATFRLTRVITSDDIPFGDIREKYVTRWGIYDDAVDKSVSISGQPTNYIARKFAYWWECGWCASVPPAVIVTGVTMQVTSVPLPALVAAAAAGVTGIIYECLPDKKSQIR